MLFVRGLFDAEEVGALGAAVSGAADREKPSAYRHRVAVLCPGVGPFSFYSIAEAEAVIRQHVAGCCLLAAIHNSVKSLRTVLAIRLNPEQ
jgi:hypothetical protein